MLEEDITEITSIPEKKMIFGKEEKERFDKETKCWICNGEFNYDVNVRDHCHFTVRYTTYVILSIENLILHLWCFITLVGMIATYL